MMHGKKAAEPSQEILDLVQSASAGFPHYVHVFNGSYAVTAGLAAGCLAASAVLAIIRFNQKALKRESTGGMLMFPHGWVKASRSPADRWRVRLQSGARPRT